MAAIGTAISTATLSRTWMNRRNPLLRRGRRAGALSRRAVAGGGGRAGAAERDSLPLRAAFDCGATGCARPDGVEEGRVGASCVRAEFEDCADAPRTPAGWVEAGWVEAGWVEAGWVTTADGGQLEP